MKQLAVMICAAAALVQATIAWADDAYIESDGTTFINSRWYMKPNGRIEVDFARTEASKPSSWLYLFGAADRDSSSTIGTRVGMFVNVNGPYFVAGDAVDKWISPSTAPDTERRIAAIDVRAMKYCYYVKGQAVVSNSLNAASTVANTATYPVALFGNMNNKGGLGVAAGDDSDMPIFMRSRITHDTRYSVSPRLYDAGVGNADPNDSSFFKCHAHILSKWLSPANAQNQILLCA